ncbi:MAG: 7TM diverse intracellular signaling domain-containing protein [Solirubrobacterales bacterium]
MNVRTKTIVWIAPVLLLAACFLVTAHRSAAGAQPNVMTIKGAQHGYALGPYLDVLEDKTRQLTVTDVASAEYAGRFQPPPDASALHFGLSNSIYWVRFRAAIRPDARNTEWFLYFPDTWIRSVRLYAPEAIGPDGKPAWWQVTELGRGRQIKPGESLLTVKTPFEPAEQPVTYYLRLQSRGPLILDGMVADQFAISNLSRNRFLFFGLYFGIFTGMFLFNLFLYFSLRERSRLFYLMYVASVAAYLFGLSNMTAEFIPTIPSDVIARVQLGILGLMSVFVTLFSLAFLKIGQLQRAFRLYGLVILLFSVIFTALSPFGNVYIMNQIATVSGSLILLSLWVIGILRWQDGYRPARFFILAFSAMLIGGTIFALAFQGILPYTAATMYALPIGSTIEVLLLSYALADRINTLRAEKMKALAQAERLNAELEEHRVSLENTVEQRTEALRQSNEMLRKMDRSKTLFLSAVSHELRTPLTVILGLAKVAVRTLQTFDWTRMGRDYPRETENLTNLVQDLDMVVQESQRLAALIDDVLDLAKIEAGKLDWNMIPVSPAEIVERAFTTMRPLALAKKLRMIHQVDPNLPLVLGDRFRLVQVLINLISNAIKFTVEGTITCTVKQADSTVVFCVADTGAGVSPEDHTRIFGIFEQGSHLIDPVEGTGLGLVICREIVSHHGGTIWLESEPGAGSQFFFSLPIVTLQEAQPLPASLAPPSKE